MKNEIKKILMKIKPGIKFKNDFFIKKDELDSLDIITFIFEVEKKYKIKINVDQINSNNFFIGGSLSPSCSPKLVGVVLLELVQSFDAEAARGQVDHEPHAERAAARAARAPAPAAGGGVAAGPGPAPFPAIHDQGRPLRGDNGRRRRVLWNAEHTGCLSPTDSCN